MSVNNFYNLFYIHQVLTSIDMEELGLLGVFIFVASVHSSTSSTKSFSARQYERERENRLLAKARERERGDGGSTSPRSLENLIDGPLPSVSIWVTFLTIVKLHTSSW